MANDGMIEFLSSDALSEMDKAIAKLNAMALKVEEVNTAIKGVNTPSGADNSIKKLNEAYREQANALKLAKQENDNYYNSQIKANQAKKSDIALSNAQTAATNKAALANEKLNSAYNRLNNARTEAKNKLRDLIASENASNVAIRKAQREFEVLDQKVRKADRAVGDFSKSVGNYKTALSGVGNLMGAFGISTGLFLGASIVKDIYETTKQLQSMDLALKMVSETQSIYASNTAFIRDISEKWGIEIKGLTEQFTQFYVNAKGKLSETDIKTTFEGIAKAGSLMGISIDKQNDAFYAFNQMLSKGTVQSEELKKQLGNALPGAIKAATMAYQELNPELKVTEQMMLNQMKAGKLISNEMVPAIIRAYQKLYGIENVNNVNTLAAAQNRLANSWTELVRAMNAADTSTFWGTQLVGFMNNAKTTLEFLAKILSNVNQINNAAGVQGQGNASEVLTNNTITTELADKGLKGKEEQKKYLKEQMLSYYNDWIYQQEKLQELVEQYNSKNQLGRYLALDLKRDMQSRKESLEYQKSMYEAYRKYIDGINNPNKGNTNSTPIGETEAEKKKRLKAEEDKLKRLEELRKNSYERRISDLEREKEQIKDLRDLETTSLEDKLFLENAYAYKQIQINQTVYDEKKRLSEGNLDLEKIALNELLTANENALSESLTRQSKLKEDAIKSDAQKTKEWYEKNPPMFIQTDEMRKQAEEAERILKRLKDEFRNYIQSFSQDLFSNAGFGETFDFFIRMDEQGKTMFDKLGELADGSNEKFAVTFQAISESAQDMFNFISNASQANFDAEYARLEREKNIAIQFAGDSTSARAEIEEQYERRRRGIQKREAESQKKLAMVNIAINTAQAIVATLAKTPLPKGLPFVIATAALGAAQLAMVASQQIPQYWKGTDNHQGGLMMINDKGLGGELVETPDGKKTIYKGENVIVDAPKGTKVKTGKKTAMMFDNSLNGMLLNNGIAMPKVEVSLDAEKITNEIKSLANTIANKEGLTIIEDERGKRKYFRKQGETKEHLNNVLNYRSNNV